ncbi:MAG: hypothetical protein WAM82_23195 [Thermoanaerobaculia bacterium]
MNMEKKSGTQGKKSKKNAYAIHARTDDGTEHFIGIGNLRVMLTDDDGSWFAQGLEINYFAQGSSIEDVQRRFQNGLRETIDFYLKLYGNIDDFMHVAPPEVWAEFYRGKPGLRKLYSQVSVHFDNERQAFPFNAIAFYGREQSAA